jgi:hypothetical protein
MKLLPADDIRKIKEAVDANHLNVIETCPATINGDKGWLGVSRGIWCRVWFDTGEKSTTLYTSMKRDRAVARFRELKEKYGT